MRILIVVHHFPPRYTGGAEWRAYRTAQALQARGHTVRVVCVERIDEGEATPVTWRDDLYEGVKVRRLSFNLANAPDPNRWEFNNLWIAEHLRQLTQTEPPDILHLISGYLTSGSVLEWAHAARIPTVVSLTDFWFLCRRLNMWRSNNQLSRLPLNPANCARCLGEERRLFRWPGRLFPQLMNWYWSQRSDRITLLQERQTFLLRVLSQASAVISPSRFLRSMYIEAGLPADRILYMRQGRDFPGLSAENVKKSATQYLRIGYLGQIAEHKGVHLLIEAVHQLPNANLQVIVYGDRSAFPRYAAQLQRRAEGDKRIQLAGRYNGQAQVSAILRDLDVIVVPSMWYENSPNVILEAHAHATPVIASNLGGMAELVQDGINGLLFNAGDAADLARNLQKILDEPETLAYLREGIQPIKSVSQELDELEHVYQSVINS